MKDIFSTKKSFRQIAENNDGYDEFSEKNIKLHKKSFLTVAFISGVSLRDFFTQNNRPFPRRSKPSRKPT